MDDLWYRFRDDLPSPSRFDPTKPLPPGWSLKQPAEGKPYFTHHAALSYSFHYPLSTTYDSKHVPYQTWGPVLQFTGIQVSLHVSQPLCFPDIEEKDEDDRDDRFGVFSRDDSENE